MVSPPALDEIAANARWLAQAFDPQAALVRLIEMDAAAYREASFLDDRMLQRPLNAHVRPWAEVASSMPASARSDARWIFHIGHVGSTLVARLLGELETVLSVREPRLLRDLAAVEAGARAPLVATVQRLMSRTFAAQQTALIKATSFVSELAAELVPPGERALFLFASPRAYIEGIMAGENSRKELQILAPVRVQRMRDRVPELCAAPASEAHLAAAAWACEMTGIEAAADRMDDRRLHWADFDIMLEDMQAAIAELCRFFGFDAPEERLRQIASGPLMRRYSKALEYDYSPGLRRELLAEARRDHGGHIDSAIAMLEKAAASSPLLARALSRADLPRTDLEKA
jgi:hypothetical protein